MTRVTIDFHIVHINSRWSTLEGSAAFTVSNYDDHPLNCPLCYPIN